MDDGKAKLTFGFKQSQKKTVIKPNSKVVTVEPVKNTVSKVYITSIEDNVICAFNNVEKEELVIPLKRSKSSFAYRLQKNYVQADPTDLLTCGALEALKKETESFERNTCDTVVKYDITIPNGHSEETTEIEDANYDEIPIEKFGVALLAGMGFDPKELDKNKTESRTIQRPKGLGLGADASAIRKVKEELSKLNKKELVWKSGARCQIIFGKHDGLYGTIQGVDGDTGRAIVSLTLAKENVVVLQHIVRLVSNTEYEQYSKCINKKELDYYKAQEAQNQQSRVYYAVDSSIPKDDYSPRSRNYSSDRPKLPKKPAEPEFILQPRRDKSSLEWLRPKLIVLCLDKLYKKGKYYKARLTIVSVNQDRCVCKTESGAILEDVCSKHLLSCIPTDFNSVVMIVHGERNGQLARLIKRDDNSQQVHVKTRAGKPLLFHFDSVCAISDPFD